MKKLLLTVLVLTNASVFAIDLSYNANDVAKFLNAKSAKTIPCNQIEQRLLNANVTIECSALGQPLISRSRRCFMVTERSNSISLYATVESLNDLELCYPDILKTKSY